jgi:tetratricopeptide (TPR) repeat protein
LPPTSGGDAAAALERSLALRSEQNDVRLRLGQAYEKLGRPDDAAAQYKAILRRRARDEKATVRLADLEESRGRLDAAEAVLRAALAKGSDPERAITMRLGRVLAKKGDDAFHAERFTDAVAFYRSALSFDLDKTVYLVNLGWAQRRAGDGASAVTAWEQALKRDAANPAALWRAVGDAELDQGRTAEARVAYARAAAADPRSATAYYALASIALDGGDAGGAARAIRDMFKTGGASEDDAVRMADLFIRHDAIESGQRVFEDVALGSGSRGLGQRGARAPVRREGRRRLPGGSDGEAVAFYRKALAADPSKRAARCRLGTLADRRLGGRPQRVGALRRRLSKARRASRAPGPARAAARRPGEGDRSCTRRAGH